MRIKAVVWLCVLLGLAPLVFLGWYRWDSSQNRGLEFGYYGAFNRIRHGLTALPGVTIARDWANQDITLEEFGFDVTTNRGEAIHLFFGEKDPARALSGDRLAQLLATRIHAQ